jgi:hypothetical protein
VIADILMTLDGKYIGYDEKCPNALEVPDVVVGTDGVTSEDPIPSYAYGWTAQASAIYYVHVMSASGDSKAKFYLTLGDIDGGNWQPSDYCKTATKVSALPFSATPSTGKDGVWFQTEGILDGTSLILEIQGVKEDVHVDILMTLDGEDNGYDEKCPDDLEAPNDLEGITSVTSEDPIPSSAYFWTAQASAIYYVHVTSASGDSDAKFKMTLRDKHGRVNYDIPGMISRKSYLRANA